ncbi:MAG: T9SS type A sorting domain-containing protein [Bacteroidales bacterium]|nr:T9SS type A sorting domain-containing protein [Bacteroidales bacterium]
MKRKFLSLLLAMVFFAFAANAQDFGKAPVIKKSNQTHVTDFAKDFDILKADQEAYTGNTGAGTYNSIVLADGTTTQTGTIGTTPFPMAEEFAEDGNVYRVDSDLGFGTVNPDDGTFTSLGTLTGISGTPTGLAWDWTSSTMYVVVLDGGNLPHLCTLDIGALVLTEIGVGTGMLIAMDFADDGYLYGPALDDENLYQIDPATGATTVIGSTGLGLNYGQDVSFDPVDNLLYTINCGDQYTYGTYNIATGAFTQIADMGSDQYAVFVVCKFAADPSAPAAVTNYIATPDAGGALTVDLSWTNPTEDVAGNALGELTIVEVYIDDAEYATYTVTSPVIGGDVVLNDASVASGGMHSFKVVGSNSFGMGIPTVLSVWVGEDVPVAPENIVLTATDMQADVSWDAPTEGVHGGYFSGTGLTYDVVRYPGAILVSDDQSGLTFSETLTEAGNYFYEVTASNAAGEGETGTSNVQLFGDFLLFEDFEAGATGWTQDGTGTWTFQAGGAYGNPAAAYEGDYNAVHLHSTTGNSTKLISPEVGISSTNNYELKFWMAQVNWVGDQDQLKVYYKDGAAGSWVEIADYPNEVATWTEETLTFTSVENPYIAFEGIDGYGYGNCVDFVTIVEGPETPTYTITFTVTDNNGGAAIEGVLIDIESGTYTGTTNASGVVTFDLEDNTYNFAATYTNYTYTGTTTFTVSGTDLDVAVGMDEDVSVNDIYAGINIYPNPSNGIFNVNVQSTFNLEVLDITGKVINTRVLTGNSTVEINTTGVYFFRFSNETGSITQRVIVQ